MVTEQIMKTLAGLIPEDTAKEIETGINSVLESAKTELEKEYDVKLKEAYSIVEGEKVEAVKIAEAGYEQAWGIISDYKERLNKQAKEFDAQLEEGYEEAYQMILEERAKNDALELKLHEEYEKRYKESYDALVEKIDQYLSLEGERYSEAIKSDLLNDPELNEKKLALDKILEVAQNYISDEDYANAVSSKVSVMTKESDELKSKVKILEAKNVRIATENNKLNEAVKHQAALLTEAKKHEEKIVKRETIEKARVVEGRGVVADKGSQVVIAEPVIAQKAVVAENTDAPVSTPNAFAHWERLAGITK